MFFLLHTSPSRTQLAVWLQGKHIWIDKNTGYVRVAWLNCPSTWIFLLFNYLFIHLFIWQDRRPLKLSPNPKTPLLLTRSISPLKSYFFIDQYNHYQHRLHHYEFQSDKGASEALNLRRLKIKVVSICIKAYSMHFLVLLFQHLGISMALQVYVNLEG